MKDNKLIGDFMGMKYSDERSFDNGEWTHSIKSLSKFQTSWDWLMPVGEKIDAMFGEDDEVDDAINRVHNAVLSFDIDNTYRAIVEFIEDYNDEK
jgi:hypothetical protein